MSDRNIKFIVSIFYLFIDVIFYSMAYRILKDNFGMDSTSFLIVMMLVLYEGIVSKIEQQEIIT